MESLYYCDTVKQHKDLTLYVLNFRIINLLHNSSSGRFRPLVCSFSFTQDLFCFIHEHFFLLLFVTRTTVIDLVTIRTANTMLVFGKPDNLIKWHSIGH